MPQHRQRCIISDLDEAGDIVARLAYNGRIFAVGPDGECDYTRVLHETCGS